MPTRPCRGTPERKATATGTSGGSSSLNSSARTAILRDRELVLETSFEAVTTAANRVMLSSAIRRSAACCSRQSHNRQAEPWRMKPRSGVNSRARAQGWSASRVSDAGNVAALATLEHRGNRLRGEQDQEGIDRGSKPDETRDEDRGP